MPKSSHASKLNDYQPISCYTIFYKVISKLLATQLADVANHLLHPTQAAFVKGKTILDNIHLPQELMRNYDRKRLSPRCIWKTDIQKVFDSVHWDFLQDILKGLHFPKTFITWIKEYIVTTTFSLAISGNIYGHFKGAKGLRQGDPLSPTYLAYTWSILHVCYTSTSGGLISTFIQSVNISKSPSHIQMTCYC